MAQKQLMIRLLYGAALCLLAAGAGASAATGQGALTASGVVTVEEVRIASEFAGQVQQIQVSEGASVRQGQPLLLLESKEIAGQLAQANAAVETAQANLTLVRSAPRVEAVAALQAQVRLAQADVQATTWRLANAQAARDDPQELRLKIVSAETQVKLAAQAVEGATADYRKLLSQRDRANYGSPEQRALGFMAAAQEAALHAAEADQRAAAVALARLTDMESDPLAATVQVRKAEGEYKIAQASARVAQAQLDDLLAGAQPGEIALAEARVALAQAQAALAQTQSGRLTLYAPSDGLVLQQVAQAGETAQPGAALLIIGDLRQATVSLFVPEPRIGEVRLGQKVAVTVDSFPGRRFEGAVTYIANRAEFTPRNVATREGRLNTFFAVRVRVANDDLALKAGMPADVAFE